MNSPDAVCQFFKAEHIKNDCPFRYARVGGYVYSVCIVVDSVVWNLTERLAGSLASWTKMITRSKQCEKITVIRPSRYLQLLIRLKCRGVVHTGF